MKVKSVTEHLEEINNPMAEPQQTVEPITRNEGETKASFIERSGDQANAQRLERRDDYVIPLQDWEYDEIEKLTGMADKHDIAGAWKLSKELDIPLQEAWENLDAYKYSLYGEDAYKVKPESAWKAIVDSFNMGKNTLNMGERGLELMRAELNGDEEYAKSIMDYYNALEEENMLLSQTAERDGWLGETIAKYGAQSAPFTLVSVGLAYIPVMGPALSFAFSASNMAGLEYIDARKHGASKESALGVSAVVGTVNGIVELALGRVAGAIGAKVIDKAKKPAAELLRRGVTDKIAEKVMKSLHLSGHWRALAQTLTRAMEENLEEGLEEVLQETVSLAGKKALRYANEEYDVPEMSWEEVGQDLYENFKGGFLGSILLGMPNAAMNAYSNYKDVNAVKTAAETVASREAFGNTVKSIEEDAKKNGRPGIFNENLSEKEKAEYLDKLWKSKADRREEAFRKQEADIAEAYSAEDFMEAVETEEDQDGEVISEEIPEVYRDEDGKLYTENQSTGENKGRFAAGNPEGGKNYGYIDYTVDEEEGTVTIDNFKMASHREAVRNDLFIDFARDFSGYEIKWEPKGKLLNDVKNTLLEINPQGKEKGLSFFGSTDEKLIADTDTKLSVAKELAEKTSLTPAQQKAFIALLEVSGKNLGGNITEFVNKNFAGSIIANESQKANVDRNLKNMIRDQLDFLTSGMTEEKAKELNLREDQVEVINNALKGVDQDTRKALAEYALYAGNKSEGIDKETFAKAKAAIDENPELKKVMVKAVSIAGQEAKGAAITVDDFRSVIYAGENADFSTFAHELAHIWRKNLTGDLLAEAEKAFGVKDGNWTRADEENFARDFEQYLYTGKAKNSALRDIFRQLAQFFKDIYQSLRNLEAQGGIKLTDDIVNVFDRILADENSGFNQKAEAKAEEKVQEKAEAKTEEKAAPEAQEEKKTSLDEVTEEAVNDIVVDPTLSEEEKNNAALNASGADVVDSLIDFFEKAAQEEIITEDEAKLNGFSMDDNGNVYEMLFMLIGPEGASKLDEIYDGEINGRRTKARRNAEKMEIDGRSVEEIARATGWKRNNDLNGTWWTEIADGEFKNYNALVDKLSRIMTLGKAAKSITDPQQMERHNMDMASLLKEVTGLKLKDVFDAKDLYKIYPELAEREVSFTMLPVPYNATIGPEGISLNLYYTADLNKLRNALIQTLQRLLQGIELDKDGGKKFYIESQQKWRDFAKFMSQSYGEDWQMHTYAANLRAISQFLNSYEYLKYHTGPRQEQVQTVSKRANMNALERNNTLFQLIGPEGAAALDEAEDKTERIDNLNIAQEMEAAGKDEKTIRFATGWEKGADKKWKYEIDDGEFVKEGLANMPEYEEWKKSTKKEKEFAAQKDFKGMGTQHSESVKLYKAMQGKEEGLVYKKLDAVYKNDELYDAYPQLRKILVYQWGKGPQEGERGHYTSGDETITLYTDNRTEEELKSTLLHEIQHAIQEIEGFAKGGSVESVIANQYNSLIDDIAPIYATIGSNDALNSKIKEYVKASNELDFNSDDIVEKINEVEAIKNNDETMLSLWDKLQDISRKYDLIYKPETAPLFDFRATDIQSPTATEALRAAKNVFETRAYSTYRGLAGEVESRNVQARMNFTTEQRRNQLLEDTEDVERKEQIVLFQTDEDGLKNSIEIDDRSLVGLHNLSEDALRHTVKMGGLANPSMAVIDTNKQGFTNFGGITLIAPKTLIAKDIGRNAGTFGADVYSPRYPSITRQVTATGRKKIRSIFWAVEDENLKEHLVENTVQKFENDRKPDFEYTKLPIAYLAEKGNKEFWKYQKSKYDDEVKEAFKALKSNSVDDPETAKFLKELFDKTMKGDYEEEIKDYEEMLKDENLTPFKRNIYKDNLEKAKARLALGEEVITENTDPNTGYLYFSPAEELRYGIEKDIKAAGKVDENATERAARELVENDPDFKKWAEEKYASVEADEKIFDGFTPSGNRKYLKHTLENVSKYMKKEAVRGGESFSYGMGSTRARVTPKWTMLKDIAKNKSRLVTREDFEKIKNELEPIYDKYVEICDNGDGFDVGEARLNEALETKNPITYLKNEYDIDISDKDEFNKFVRDLKAMPTEYFETKFTRPVYLNEFYGAVIPKNASAETRKTLEDAGLVIKEYEEGSDRLDAIKEIGSNANGMVMFQTAYNGTSADFKDANIVDHIRYQTETDLKNLAQQFESWQDFMEYFEAPFIDEEMAAMVPEGATTSWYRDYWETANDIMPTTEEMQQQKEKEFFNNDREDKDPVTADAIFLSEIRSAGRLEAFLKQIDEVMKVDADEWANDALDEQDREDAENIRKVQQQIRALHNQAFVRNSLRVAGGKPLSDKMRKNILTAIRNATRSYRAIYATVMSDSRFTVDENAEQAAINELAERGKKAGLEKDPTLMSPTERIKYAEDIREKEIAEQIRTGKFKYDEEAEFYIKRQQKALNQAGKDFKEYKAKVDADFNELGDVMQRDLMKLYGKLLEVKNELEYKKMNVPSKLEANIKTIGKYNRDLSALQDNYSTLYTKYKDAEKAIEINAEFRQKLDHMETYQKAKSEYKQLRKEQKAIDELKEIRKKLVKRTMRSVDFKNVEYEHAKALIALQRIFDPNMRQGINKWIGIESVTAREIWSDYKTDEEERKRIIDILMKSPTGSELVRKLDNAKTERDFDLISDKDKKSLERRLANSNWIKSLQLDRLKYGREQAIQLDITEVERKLPTGEIDQYGNEKYTNEWVAEYSDEIARLIENYFPDDLITKVQAKPFQYWTIGEMEDLAKTFQDVYTAGRDALNAKRIREQTDAYRIRELIARQVRDTGIVINEDDPEDVKKKKEEKIAKILGTSNAVKGLFDEKESRFMSKINSILHGYHDANIRRVARILDGYSEGTCTEMLYWKENECYTRQENSKNRRFKKVASVMEANGIDVTELYKQVAINYRGEVKKMSIDKLLFIAQAVANNEAYQKEQEKAGIPERMRDEESGYQAVVYGNLMTVDEKKPLIEMDQKLKEEEEKRKADLILATQLGDEESIRELQKVSLETHDENGNLKLPGREQIKATCKERLEEFMKEYEKLDPKFKKLQEAIAEDYSQEFERINRASVEEFNMPVWREKWYLPLIRKGATGDTHEARVRADLLGAVAGTGKAGTEKGFTQKRVRIAPEHQTPVELGLYSTWADSVERNEHFINYASYVRELNRLFANKDAQPLMQEIQNRYGSGMKRYIDSYIKEVANPNTGEPVKDFDKVIRLLRGSTAPAYLGFKASSVLKQALSSPAPFMQFVSPIEYTKAAMRCIKPEVQEAIQAKSVFMRNRVFDPIVDVVNEQKNNASNPLVYRAKEVLAKGMQPLEWIDWACVAPGWLAVYEKERAALLGNSEAMVAKRLSELKELNDSGLMGERRSMRDLEAQARAETDEDIETMAVNKADDATRLCQPSNRKADLAPMFKNGSELQKAVLQFQTALNVIWQNIRYDLPYAVRTKQYKQIVGMTMGYVMAGIAMGLLADGLGDDDEDEAQKVRNFVWYSTTQFTDSMPVVGSMVTATAEKIITGKAGYQSSNDIFPTFTKFKEGTFALTDENYRKAAAKFAEGTALTLGLPTSGAKEAARAFGIGDGDGELEFYPEAFMGRRKED